MDRRQFLTICTGLFAAPDAVFPQSLSLFSGPQNGHALDALLPAWEAWKLTYLSSEGRVIDAFQQDASHSESQGYGLYLATRFHDEATFRRIYAWTEANLALREDGLLAWRWIPDADPHVPDMNNATDGDLFYAWALMRGATLFSLPQCRSRAETMTISLEQSCLIAPRNAPDKPFLLPAADGFRRQDGIIINPSYWMPSLMQDLADSFNRPRLRQARDTGLTWLTQAAQADLAPDWIMLGPNGTQPPPSFFSANTGYEAMRVPLYLCMSGLRHHPMVARFRSAYLNDWRPEEGTPTVMDPKNGAAQERSASPGYAALAGLMNCTGLHEFDGTLPTGPVIPHFTTDQPYYPATLHLLVLLAQIEGFPECVPL